MNLTHLSPDDPKLTAFALGELDPVQSAEIAAAIAQDPVAKAAVDEIRALAGQLEEALENEPVIASPSKTSLPEVALHTREAKVIRFPIYWATGLAAAGLLALLGAQRFATPSSSPTQTQDVAVKSTPAIPDASASPVAPLPVVDSHKRPLAPDPDDVNPAPLREDGLSRARSVVSSETQAAKDESSDVASAPSVTPDPIEHELLALTIRYNPPTVDVNHKIDVPMIGVGTDFAAASKELKSSGLASLGLTLKNPAHKNASSDVLSPLQELVGQESKEDAAGRRNEATNPLKKPTSATVE